MTGVGLFAAGIVIGGVHAVGRGALADSGIAAQAPTILRDASGQCVLTVQLQAGRADTGSFDFYVAAKGDYVGTVTVTSGASAADVLSMGTATTAEYHALSGGAPRQVTMHVDGTVTLPDFTAVVTVLADGSAYLLHTDHGSSSAATTAAQQAIGAMATQSWSSLYGMLASAIASQFTQAQFVQSITGPTGTTILSAATAGTGQLATQADGYTYFTQPITVQARAATGAITSYTSKLYLVLENGQWKVVGTDALS